MGRRMMRPVADSGVVVGYTRVSTQEQGQNGHGLAAQRDAITSACTARGWTLLAVYEDVTTGAATNGRHELAEAVARLERGEAGGLVVSKLDRLSRSVIDAAQTIYLFRRRGWNLTILDLGLDLSTPMGEAMASMAAVFAQLERRMIGERTKAGLEAKANRDPGWMPGVPVRMSADVEREVVRLREDGLTMKTIADTLNGRGVPTATSGARWHASTVQTVLRRHERRRQREAA